MNDFEDTLTYVIGIWIAIILFITCPIWGIPYLIISNIIDVIKNRKSDE